MTRSLAARFAAAALLALALPALAAAYALPDLAGPWHSQSLASGPGAPWWERGRVAIDTLGHLDVIATTNYGELDTLAFTAQLSAAGILTVPGAPSFHGALDAGRTVLVATDTWAGGSDAGTAELKVALKTVSGAALADLAGTWETHSIVSGASAPWWLHARFTVAANGAFTGTFVEQGGAPYAAGGTFGVAPDGSVTLSLAPGAEGWLDAGRTVLAITNTWGDGSPGSTELAVALKMANAYTPADLAGTWEMHSLATGPGAPWWSRGQIVVAANGSFTGTMTDPSGGSHPTSGTLTLAADGSLSRSGSAAAHGALDAGRTVMVWTDTWTTGSPGTSELLIGVRTSGGTADVPASGAATFALERVQPNPARGAALAIRFTLAHAGAARLELLDVNGRRVAARDAGAFGPGAHAVTLAPETRLPPGLYFVRLSQGGEALVQRVTVLE